MLRSGPFSWRCHIDLSNLFHYTRALKSAQIESTRLPQKFRSGPLLVATKTLTFDCIDHGNLSLLHATCVAVNFKKSTTIKMLPHTLMTITGSSACEGSMWMPLVYISVCLKKKRKTLCVYASYQWLYQLYDQFPFSALVQCTVGFKHWLVEFQCGCLRQMR